MRVAGSSPRVRGKRVPGPVGAPRRRLIPARAGKTTAPTPPSPAPPAHPRACGENVRQGVHGFSSVGSSPRVRGKRDPWIRTLSASRLIPARAGKTAVLVVRVV